MQDGSVSLTFCGSPEDLDALLTDFAANEAQLVDQESLSTKQFGLDVVDALVVQLIVAGGAGVVRRIVSQYRTRHPDADVTEDDEQDPPAGE